MRAKVIQQKYEHNTKVSPKLKMRAKNPQLFIAGTVTPF